MRKRFEFSRTFKISGILFVVGIALAVISQSDGFIKAIAVLLLVVASPVFTVSAIRHLLRGLLWRVGSRLFISYVLIGVVPIPFFLGFLYAGVMALCGQMAATRSARSLQEPRRELRILADKISFALRDRSGEGEQEVLVDSFLKATTLSGERIDAVLIRPGGRSRAWGEAAVVSEPLAKALAETGQPSFFVFRENRIFFAAAGAVPSGTLLLLSPLSDAVLDRVEKKTGIDVWVAPASVSQMESDGASQESSGAGLLIETGEEKKPVRVRVGKAKPTPTPRAESKRQKEPAGGDPVRGKWIHWFALLDVPVLDWDKAAFDPDRRVLLTVASSVAQELSTVLWLEDGGADQDSRTGRIVWVVMKVLALLTVSVYFIASLIAAILVFRIARATRRLSHGFDAIEKGDFSFRLKLGGRDQLANLIGSFNQMAAHLEESVESKARQEAVEHELAVARDLQKRLLPPPGFTFPGVEIAVDFRPAAAIGGDFYHLIAEGERCLAVVIADVSGHGLPTGIVMASAKASLSSLARSGAETIEMLKSLDEEIRRTTDSRTFVTLAYLRFRLDRRVVEYTNAGHIYPYRIDPEGRVTSIPNPARPLGVALNAMFKTVEVPLSTGDLWVLISDGIVEAQSPSGEVFGFEKMESLLGKCGGRNAEEVKQTILSEWRAFTLADEPADDRTLVVLKILPPLPENAVADPARAGTAKIPPDAAA
ncbi:MAG: hypothetical protein DIJKHBIC_02989 [Thermoanaerobaculia bacterium]|nr:hypothetical protein [Thermoanaerobaculia bacterium]